MDALANSPFGMLPYPGILDYALDYVDDDDLLAMALTCKIFCELIYAQSRCNLKAGIRIRTPLTGMFSSVNRMLWASAFGVAKPGMRILTSVSARGRQLIRALPNPRAPLQRLRRSPGRRKLAARAEVGTSRRVGTCSRPLGGQRRRTSCVRSTR